MINNIDPVTGICPTAMLSPAEVGQTIGKSPWTVRRMLHRGELGFRQIGNRRKVTGAVLIAFLTGTDVPDRGRVMSSRAGER